MLTVTHNIMMIESENEITSVYLLQMRDLVKWPDLSDNLSSRLSLIILHKN